MSKSIIDEGFRHELVEGAVFEGPYDIPVIQPLPDTVPLPVALLPFDKRRLTGDLHQWVHCYLFDTRFSQLITQTEKYATEIARFDGAISPDPSLYRDMPIATQIANTYLNRAVGHYLQRLGMPVICNVRWSDDRSFPFAFDGAPRHNTVAVSNHGCMRSREDRYWFARGFDEMLVQLDPKRVVLHGTMPQELLERYNGTVEIRHYPSSFSSSRKAA